MGTEWKCLKIEKDDFRKTLEKTVCYDHPLKASGPITMVESKGTKQKSTSNTSSTLSLDPLSLALDGIDPLSQFALLEAVDPLSQMAAEHETKLVATANVRKKDIFTEKSDSWSARRGNILSKYITSERLSITTIINGGEIIKTQLTAAEKVKHRLEQLDDFGEGTYQHSHDLTQQEYVSKIQGLNQELVQAWKSDQRVKALKIGIQCSKLLADTAAMQFYPSKFVLITDILDIFGKLVYDRLRGKSDTLPSTKQSQALPDNFTPDMVSESAKETCLNWFYKIASIRELLPRLYVEMSIIKCYNFIDSSAHKEALMRIAKMIRGIGDPLVAIYARCYLFRVGGAVTNDMEYMKESFIDFLDTYHTIFHTGIRSEISKQKLELTTYLSLYSPALDYVMQNLILNASDVFLEEVKSLAQDKKNNALLLMTILQAFRPEFIATHALELVAILSTTNNDGITRGSLFRLLGISLGSHPPVPELRLIVLNEAWKTINTLTNVAEYINCVEMWTEFVVKNFDLKILNKFLSDVLTHVQRKRAFENHYQELQSIVDKIVSNTKDFDELLTMDNFLPLVDLFQKDSVKLEVCKNILAKYKIVTEEANDVIINDQLIIHAFMCIGKVLNDSVNALTVDDERRQISSLISFFIRRVSYKRDVEQQLSFYVDARATFTNLDSVYVTLVHCVNELSVETRRIVKGQHNRKTMAFVKACAAYSFITIPTIISTINRMDLYLLSGHVALLNQCLGQADACLEAALNLILELPKTVELDGKQKSTEPYLQTYVAKFLATLILVPDSPEQGLLYLLRLLMDQIKQYPFETGITLSLISLGILDFLSVIAQEVYPYHIQNLISNDQLYGSDPKFINEINNICSQVVDDVLAQLKKYGEQNQMKAQCSIALELFSRVAVTADLQDDKLFMLAGNLWNLIIKNRSAVDQRSLVKFVQYLESINKRRPQKRRTELIERIKVKL